jgi:hypothetical protein
MEALAKVVGVEPHELEYRVTRSRGVQDVNIAWPDHVRGHDRLAFEDYLQLSDEKRKLVRELIAELAKGAPGKLR